MSRSKQHDRNRRNAIEGGRGKGREHPNAAVTRAYQQRKNRDLNFAAFKVLYNDPNGPAVI